MEDREVVCGALPSGATYWRVSYVLGERPVEDCKTKPLVLARDSEICCLYKPSSQSCSSISRIYIILHYFVLFVASSLDFIFCFAIRRWKI